MESGRIRKRKTNFTAVSNCALQDKTLSYKAKGLYATISYYISIPDFVLYKNFLVSLSTDGTTSFDNAWKELKEHNYLIQYKIQTPKGFVYEYELQDNNTEIKEADKKENAGQEPTGGKSTPGKGNDGEVPTHGKSMSGNPTHGNPKYGKPVSINNNQENKNINNNILNNNKKEIINRFILKISNVNQNEISDVENKNNKLNLFLNSLKSEELLTIDNLSKTDAISFYLAIINVFDNPEIQNKEGYLRTVLKNPISFIENFEIQTMRKEFVPSKEEQINLF